MAARVIVGLLLAFAVNCMEELLDGKADVPASREGVESVISKRANEYGTTSLMIAARTNDRELVKALLANHADTEACNRNGETALMIAAESAQLDVVQTLLASGANIEARDHDGKTALVFAVKSDRGKHVRTLTTACLMSAPLVFAFLNMVLTTSFNRQSAENFTSTGR